MGRAPTQYYETRNLKKIHQIHFLLFIYCWACSLLLRVVCCPSKTPLEERKFIFGSGYQLGVVSGIRMGTCVHFSLQL